MHFTTKPKHSRPEKYAHRAAGLWYKPRSCVFRQAPRFAAHGERTKNARGAGLWEVLPPRASKIDHPNSHRRWADHPR